jgi:hypothetical protein
MVAPEQQRQKGSTFLQGQISFRFPLSRLVLDLHGAAPHPIALDDTQFFRLVKYGSQLRHGLLQQRVARAAPDHAVYEHLDFHGSQFVHAATTQSSDQVLLDNAFRRGVRVRSPSRFFDGDVLADNLLKCRRRIGRAVFAGILCY